MNDTIRGVAIVTAGVILAGYVMYAMRDIDFIDDARNGFDV